LRRVTNRLLGAVRIGCTALTVAVMADWLADPTPRAARVPPRRSPRRLGARPGGF